MFCSGTRRMCEFSDATRGVKVHRKGRHKKYVQNILLYILKLLHIVNFTIQYSVSSRIVLLWNLLLLNGQSKMAF